jgi:polyisoprenoid-binding protein YceI
MTTSAALITRTATTWTIDPSHSLAEFSVRHMMFTTVKGRFTDIRGAIVENADDLSASSVEVTIDAASVTTADPQRDAHLRSADFFDVETYPTLTFTSTRIEGSPEAFTLTGMLTLHGQAREATFNVESTGRGVNPFGKHVAGYSAETTINRKDYGLNWNVALETGGVLVSDSIKISLEIQAVRQDS